MLRIELNNIGRRFNREWIFRRINLTKTGSDKTAIIGSNGSGKSTLLQIISGHLSPSEGNILYQLKSNKIETDEIYTSIGFAAPYMELIEEFTLLELFTFHKKFKPFINNYSAKELIEIIELEKATNKEIKNFSSGMKQRVKLACAILADVPLILLDEPATNLDKNAINWYRNLVEKYASDKMMFICSNNQPEEFDFCENILVVEKYKENTV